MSLYNELEGKLRKGREESERLMEAVVRGLVEGAAGSELLKKTQQGILNGFCQKSRAAGMPYQTCLSPERQLGPFLMNWKNQSNKIY